MMTTTYPKLTKRDSQGVPRYYWAEVRGSEYCTFSQKTRSGNVLQSAMTRPREQSLRSPQEQCHFEVRAIYEKRERLGWEPYGKVRRQRGVDPQRYYAPMLAHKYPKLKPPLPGLAQPKLDGIRCIATRTGLWTRKNTRITSVPHVEREALAFLERHKNLMCLDGELYLHGWALHKISGLARRDKPSTESMMLQFHVFDCEEAYSSTFETRVKRLNFGDAEYLVAVDTQRIESEEDMDFLHARWLRAGYEGSMYRDPDAFYEHKRTKSLIKRKDFQEKEFRITGIREGNGAWRGCAKAIDYVDHRGVPFESGIRGTQDYLRLVLKQKDKIIGKKGTVRFFNLTPDRGVPYLPVTVNLGRWDID